MTLKRSGEAIGVLSRSIEQVVYEAELMLVRLNKLEERLGRFHEILVQEDSSLRSAKFQLFSELWTKLGGNRVRLHDYDNQLEQANKLDAARKRTLACVVSVILTLTGITSDLAVLVVEPTEGIPVEVHLMSLQIGTQRLTESLGKRHK